MARSCPLNKTVNILNNDTNLISTLQFNLFTEDIEFSREVLWDSSAKKNKPLSDMDMSQLKYYMSSIHQWETSRDVLNDACLIVSLRQSYHPVKKFIESVEWDGVPRCDEWLIKAVGCEDNFYTRMAAAKFLIATVSRIYNPGCKFDHMLILEGPQSIGKSTLVELMAGEFYLDTNFDNKDKDMIDIMRGSFWVEISELSGMNKKEVDWLKSFLSRKVDRIRLPYARRSSDFQRKCVFIGTYNPSGNNMYLRDDTGNRRFWPIECRGCVDFNYIRENRGQLWAEALVRFKNGEDYYIKDPSALKILESIHGERELESPTHRKIRDYIKMKSEVSMIELIEDCLKINTNGKMPRDLVSISTIIGIIMRKLKWRKGSNENRDRYYSPNGELYDNGLGEVVPDGTAGMEDPA